MKTKVAFSAFVLLVVLLVGHAEAQDGDTTIYLPVLVSPPPKLYDGAFSSIDPTCGPWRPDPAFYTLFPYCHDLIIYAVWPPQTQMMRYKLPVPYTHRAGTDVISVILTRNYLRDARRDVRVGLKYQGIEAYEWCVVKDPINNCSFRIDWPPGKTFDEIMVAVDYLYMDGYGEMLDLSWLTMTEEP